MWRSLLDLMPLCVFEPTQVKLSLSNNKKQTLSVSDKEMRRFSKVSLFDCEITNLILYLLSVLKVSGPQTSLVQFI